MGIKIIGTPSGTKVEIDGKSVNQIFEDNKNLKNEVVRLKTILSFLPKWLRVTIDIIGLISVAYFAYFIFKILYNYF